MNCIDGKCKRTITYFEIDDEHAIVPFECEIGELKQLFSYFHYKAPNVDSLKSPYLEPAYHEGILEDIVNGNENFHFCPQNAVTDDELKKLNLNGTIVCSKCKRFLCKRMTSRNAKRDTTRKETDLECLLRHLRNSIAHSHIFVIQGGNYTSILFEDQNDKGNTTARIVCCQADLRKWRSILEKAVNDHK